MESSCKEFSRLRSFSVELSLVEYFMSTLVNWVEYFEKYSTLCTTVLPTKTTEKDGVFNFYIIFTERTSIKRCGIYSCLIFFVVKLVKTSGKYHFGGILCITQGFFLAFFAQDCSQDDPE